MWVLQQLHAFVRNRERTAENESADGVRNDDDRNEGNDRVVDESARVNRDFIEAKGKRDQRCHDRMQTEKRGEGDKNAD